VNFFDAHGLTDEDRAEIYFLATQTDATTAHDDPDLAVERGSF
jgi:hypothetical protein